MGVGTQRSVESHTLEHPGDDNVGDAGLVEM